MWDKLVERIMSQIHPYIDIEDVEDEIEKQIREEVEKFVKENVVQVYFKVDSETAKKAKGSD